MDYKVPAGLPHKETGFKDALWGGLDEMADQADRENASEAIKALTEIALETKNAALAESCRKTIMLLLEEFSLADDQDHQAHR